MIDFHTHILPDIDDGSSCVDESVRMIEALCMQGVNKILLTPHFYAYMLSANSFVEKRDNALKKLLGGLEKTKLNVSLYLGSEVLFYEELWRISEIKEFCVYGTEYMLLEMPFSSWENHMVESVVNLTSRGVVPVIAHFERYLKYKGNYAKIKELVDSGVLLQMNCRFLNKLCTRSKALKFIKKGAVIALGTDCHNVSDRAPDFENTDKILKSKLSKNQYQSFVARQEALFKKATKVYPEK